MKKHKTREFKENIIRKHDFMKNKLMELRLDMKRKINNNRKQAI